MTDENILDEFDGTPAHLLTGWRRERAFEMFERWLDSMNTDEQDEYAKALGYEDCDENRRNFVDDLFDKWLDNECNPPTVEECML